MLLQEVKREFFFDDVAQAQLLRDSTRCKLRSFEGPEGVEVIDLVSSDDEEIPDIVAEKGSDNAGALAAAAAKTAQTGSPNALAAGGGAGTPPVSSSASEKPSTDVSSISNDSDSKSSGKDEEERGIRGAETCRNNASKESEISEEEEVSEESEDLPSSSESLSSSDEEESSSDDEVSAGDSDLQAEALEDAEDEEIEIVKQPRVDPNSLGKRKRVEQDAANVARTPNGRFKRGGGINNNKSPHQADLRDYFQVSRNPENPQKPVEKTAPVAAAAAAATAGPPPSLTTPPPAAGGVAGQHETPPAPSLPMVPPFGQQQSGRLEHVWRMLVDLCQNDPQASEELFSWVLRSYRDKILDDVLVPEMQRRNALHMEASLKNIAETTKNRVLQDLMHKPEIQKIMEAACGEGGAGSSRPRQQPRHGSVATGYYVTGAAGASAPSPSRPRQPGAFRPSTTTGINGQIFPTPAVEAGRKVALGSAHKSSTLNGKARVFPGSVLDSAVVSLRNTLDAVKSAVKQKGKTPCRHSPADLEDFEKKYQAAAELVWTDARPLAPRVFAEGTDSSIWPGFEYVEKSFWGGEAIPCLDDALLAEFERRNLQIPPCMELVLRGGAGYAVLVTRSLITQGKGWGLRALQGIPAGSCVLQYHGEYLDCTEEEERQQELDLQQEEGGSRDGVDASGVPLKACYSFTVDSVSAPAAAAKTPRQVETFLEPEDGSTPVWCDLSCRILDSRFLGNASRFINHSCSPNLTSREVNVPFGPSVVLQFALRDIKRGEELTLDYTEGWDEGRKDAEKKAWQRGEAHRACRCGARNCRQWTF